MRLSVNWLGILKSSQGLDRQFKNRCVIAKNLELDMLVKCSQSPHAIYIYWRSVAQIKDFVCQCIVTQTILNLLG